MITLFESRIPTPLGDMYALVTNAALCALEFDGPSRRDRLDRRLRRWFPPHTVEGAEPTVIADVRRWLDAYFAGSDICAAPNHGSAARSGLRLPNLPLAFHGTPFEQAVWRALLEIPPGETRSYGELARSLGSPGASRAVGLANGANPIAIIVPCHRVIGASGSLTGYGGGLGRKRWLLDHEKRWQSARLF